MAIKHKKAKETNLIQNMVLGKLSYIRKKKEVSNGRANDKLQPSPLPMTGLLFWGEIREFDYVGVPIEQISWLTVPQRDVVYTH